MNIQELREQVCEANRALVKHDLVTLTWGNVSGINDDRDLIAIKPSGVAYEVLNPEDIVVVDLDCQVVEGALRPSSDTPTHILLYKYFTEIGGVAHTHSTHATIFAQARLEIPCLGTTHADHFAGPVPVTRALSFHEVAESYECNTGMIVVERFRRINPLTIPAVLVAGHAPFTWGKDVMDSVKNAIALEAVAKMAIGTYMINEELPDLEDYILNKHFLRKHGPLSYYGQPKS